MTYAISRKKTLFSLLLQVFSAEKIIKCHVQIKIKMYKKGKYVKFKNYKQQ